MLAYHWKGLDLGGNMRKVFNFAAIMALALIMCACAKMPLRGDYVEDVPPALTESEDEGTVYFLREGAFMGGGISYFIHEDDQKIGLLKSGSYFIHRTSPGKRTFWAETEAKAAVTLDIEAGKTYYIEGSVGLGMWAGRPELTEITKPMADKLLPDLKYIRLASPAETQEYKAKEAGGNSGSSM